MNNYPYSPNLLNDLTNLCNDYIENVKKAIQTHGNININDVDIFNEDISAYDDYYTSNVTSTYVTHNDFLLTEITIGQSKL